MDQLLRLQAVGVLCAAVLPFAAAAAPESYTIDPYHTYPYFMVGHFGVGNMMGRFDKTTGDNERGSRPRARDEHLRTADFFNVAEFLRMTYKGTATRFNGDAPACIPDPRTKGQRARSSA